MAAPAITLGHGIPITVNVDGNNKLVVSNTQPLYTPADLTPGYAPMVLVDNESVDLMSSMTFTRTNPLGVLGNYQFTTLPGFNVSGVVADSPLSLQVIPRPVKGTGPVAARMLWHWSRASQSVAIDPAGESLVVGSDAGGVVQGITVPQTANTPLSITVANPVQNGVDEHYLEYLLGDPPADVGAYGFFARLTSPNYGTSDPFLVILNDGISDLMNPGPLLTAALAINNAALLTGDYNHDDVVDSADYTIWKSSFRSTTQLAADGNGDGIVDAADYTNWRDHLGLQYSGSGAGSESPSGAAAPEPSTFALAVLASFAVARLSSMRCASNRPHPFKSLSQAS
jgi:hypothetical protein